MSRISRREPSKQFSVSFPNTLIDEIDTICATNFMTRTSWLVTAAKEKVSRDRLDKINKLKEREKYE